MHGICKQLLLVFIIGQVSDDERLFFSNESVDAPTHVVEDHDPLFLDEIVNELLANTELTTLCEDNVQCLFDYNQTGDATIGAQTAMFLQDSELDKNMNCKYDCVSCM